MMMRLLLVMLLMLLAIPPGSSWGEAPLNPPGSPPTPSQDMQEQMNDVQKRLAKIEKLTQPVENLPIAQVVKALQDIAASINSTLTLAFIVSLVSLLLVGVLLIGFWRA